MNVIPLLVVNIFWVIVLALATLPIIFVVPLLPLMLLARVPDSKSKVPRLFTSFVITRLSALIIAFAPPEIVILD